MIRQREICLIKKSCKIAIEFDAVVCYNGLAKEFICAKLMRN